MSQITINFLVAFVWSFLNAPFTLSNFIIGYILGAVLLIAFRKQLRRPLYLQKLWAGIKLTGIFIRELFIANFQVLKLVYMPGLNIQPGIIEVPTSLTTPMEITLLANMITLTPGTMTIEVATDNRSLFVHVLNIDDADKIRASIYDSFEKHIMEVMR